MHLYGRTNDKLFVSKLTLLFVFVWFEAITMIVVLQVLSINMTTPHTCKPFQNVALQAQKKQSMFVIYVVGLVGFFGGLSSATCPDDYTTSSRFGSAINSLTVS